MSNLASYRQIQMLGARASASTPNVQAATSALLNYLDVQAAASALLDYLQTNGCTQNSFAECSAFQAAANAAGLTPTLKVDGKYGPCTQAVLQAVIDAGWVAADQPAPASCFPGSCNYVPTQPPSPPPSPSPPSTIPTTTSPPQHSFPPSPARWLLRAPAAPLFAPRARSTGLGALTDPDVQAAASALLDYLQTNGCTQDSFTECSTFQAAANAAGLTPSIKVDGKYGPCTQEALQSVINAGWAATGNSGPPQLAPVSCFPGSCVGGKYVPPGGGGQPSPPPNQPSPPQHSFPPSPPPNQPPTQQQATATTSSNNTALIVVGVVAVAAIGGAALYLRSAKKRSR